VGRERWGGRKLGVRGGIDRGGWRGVGGGCWGGGGELGEEGGVVGAGYVFGRESGGWGCVGAVPGD